MSATLRQKIAALYVGYFNRAPDAQGLSYWQQQAASSQGSDFDLLKQISSGFSQHPQFQVEFGGLTSQQFVEKLYINMLGNQGDVGGISYWVNRLDGAEHLSRPDMVAQFINDSLDVDIPAMYASGALTEIEYTAALQRQNKLLNKVTVALSFADQLASLSVITNGADSLDADPAYLLSQQVVEDVTDSQQTVTNMQSIISESAAQLGAGASVSSVQQDLLSDLVNGILSGASAEATGDVGIAGDQDRIQLSLTAGKPYLIQLQSTLGSNLDPKIVSILDPSGNVIANTENDNFGLGLNSRMNLEPVTSGVYTLIVGGANNTVGQYWVGLNDLSATNTEINSVGSASLGTLFNGSIGLPFNQDSIAVSLQSGQEYVLTLRAGNGNVLNQPKIAGVYDASGRLLANSVAQAQDGEARLVLIAPSDGTYYVRVSDAYDDVGSYGFSYAKVEKVIVDSSIEIRSVLKDESPTSDEKNAVDKDGGDKSSYSVPVRTADDYPASVSTTGHLSVGGSVTGNIETAYDQDWFYVDLQAGLTYSIAQNGSPTSEGTNTDPYIRGIYNSNGTLISNTSDDDSGAGYNALLSFTPPSTGRYYIAAGGYSSQTGTYTLKVAVTGGTVTDDYQATTATSGSVAVGGSSTGSIETAGDADWFAVNLVAGQSYGISVNAAATGQGTLADPRLSGVYNSSGSLVANTSDNDSGTGNNAYVAFNPSQSGTYYVAASAADGSSTGTYRVLVESLGSVDDYLATIQTSGSVSVGGSVSGNIEQSSDQDWFAVSLTAGYRYTFNLEGTATTAGTLSDPYIRGIYSASGTFITGTTDDDSGTGYNALVTYEPTVTGTYFVAAGAYSSYTGSYRLSVQGSLVDLPASSSTNASVAVNSSTQSSLSPTGDVDWMSVSLIEGHDYLIGVNGADTGQGTLLNPSLLGVYTSSSQLLSGSADEDSGTGLNALVQVQASATGTYYVAAGSSTGGTGTYTVTVQDLGLSDALPESISTSGYLSIGGASSSSINFANDRDWFGVDLTAGHRYQFSLEGTPTSMGTLSDPYIRGIYDAQGQLIANTTDDDSGVGYNALLSFIPTASGRYYLSAGAYGSSTGTYRLSVVDDGVVVVDIPNNTTTSSGVSTASPANSTINSAGDVDWFYASLVAGHQYGFTLAGSPSGAGTLADPYITGIYSSNGMVYSGTSDHDGGIGANAYALFTAPSTGTYYVGAAGENGATGTYTLSYVDMGLTASTPTTTDLPETIYTTGSVMVGGSSQSVIHASGDRDWFAVSLVAGTTYSISLEGSPTSAGTLSDPYIRGVYNASGQLLSGTMDDDSGTGTNALLVFTPTQTGTYYVSAGAYSSYTGTYTLRVVEGIVMPDTPDLAATTATLGAVSINGSTTSVIETANDRDWFAVDVTSGRRYQVDIEGRDSQSGTLGDPYLYGIYAADGSVVTGSADDDSGTGFNARLFFEPEVSGRYYVAAGAVGSQVGSYKVSISDLGVIDIPDSDQTNEQINIGATVTSQINQSGDKDWFKATLTAGHHYRFDLMGRDSSNGTLSDPYIVGIYNDQSQLISGTSDDDSGVGYDSSVIYSPQVSGTYFISAGAYSNNTGTYSLRLTEVAQGATGSVADIPNNTSTTAVLNIGGASSSRVDSVGDQDWFKVSLTAGIAYEVTLSGYDSNSGDLADPYIYGIYNASGQLISGTSDNDSSVGRDAFIAYTPATSGNYFISAGSANNGIGSYSLTVRESTQTTPTTPIPVQSQGSWNIMVYVAADNDLERFGLSDVNEMESVTLPNGVNVTVMIDRAAGYSTLDGNWTDTRRGIISNDSDMSRISSNLQSVGELNMGSAQTLTDFINWSAQTAPSDNYALVIWDHGGGLSGVAWDAASGNDRLSYSEISSAIAASSVGRFDIIGFDACLMGVLDQYYSLRDLADIVVASEETEPGDGWDYAGWLSVFNQGAGVSATQVANQLVQSYGQFYNRIGDNSITLSAIDTAQLSGVTSSLASFAAAYQSSGAVAESILQAARSTATHFYYNDYVDLYGLMQAVSQNSNAPSAMQTAANSVMQAVDAAVLSYVGHNGSGSVAGVDGMDGAYGISYYFPTQATASYNSSSFPLLAATGWSSVYDSYWA